MPKFHALDRVDRKLLNLLQKDNQISTRVLADKVHISQPTCLRRMRELRQAGIISADVALVDPFALGYGMLAFLEVSLINQSDEHMQEFEARMAKEMEMQPRVPTPPPRINRPTGPAIVVEDRASTALERMRAKVVEARAKSGTKRTLNTFLV